MRAQWVLLVLAVVACCVSAELVFFVIGDWGGQDLDPYTTEIQLAVRNAMKTYADAEQPEFFVSTGDNMYDKGPKNLTDPRFQQSFEDVYNATSLSKRWYMSLGDHDWLGNVSAQIAYTGVSNKWYLPSESYEVMIDITGTSAQLHLIVVDGWDLTFEGKNLGGPALTETKGQATLKWLEDTLKKSTARWTMVVMHYPAYSGAAKGPKNPDLVYSLVPLLEQYKVDMFVAGHDHTLQHLQRNDIDYVICGMGSAAVPTWDAIDNLDSDVNLRFHFPKTSNLNGGFAIIQVDEDSMTIRFIQDTGLELYRYVDTPMKGTATSAVISIALILACILALL